MELQKRKKKRRKLYKTLDRSNSLKNLIIPKPTINEMKQPVKCRILRDKVIPDSDFDAILENTTAGAECDYTFLCFEEGYYKVRDSIDASYTIIDFGTGYAFQAYLFKDFNGYIGVDVDNGGAFACSMLPNTKFYQMDANKWIESCLREQALDLQKTVAICSYNPSYSNADKCSLIKETFPKYYLKYCSWEEVRL